MSATGTPSAPCRRMNAFWASENFEAFIVFRSSQPGENNAENSNSERSNFRGADQKDRTKKRSRFTESRSLGFRASRRRALRPSTSAASMGLAARTSMVGRRSSVGWRSHAKRLRQLQDENAKLKRLLADATLDAAGHSGRLKPTGANQLYICRFANFRLFSVVIPR
jgi:putative transposase